MTESCGIVFLKVERFSVEGGSTEMLSEMAWANLPEKIDF
jgi:hypothetical protein